MTRVNLRCPQCGYTARRALAMEPGSRGVHETRAEPARCPKGHGELVREDRTCRVCGRHFRTLYLLNVHQYAAHL